jgi:hypothetical protein
VEFATRVPDRLKIRNGVGKYILKAAVADLLPAALLSRPKMGFPTPLRPWLLEPGTQPLIDSLTDRDGLLASFTNRGEMNALIERHRARQEDATDRLWRLLNLQVWGDLFGIVGWMDRCWQLSDASRAQGHPDGVQFFRAGREHRRPETLTPNSPRTNLRLL